MNEKIKSFFKAAAVTATILGNNVSQANEKLFPVKEEIVSSLPDTSTKEKEYKAKFDRWVRKLPDDIRVRAAIGKLDSVKPELLGTLENLVEIDFEERDVPGLLKPGEKLHLVVVRYDRTIRNNANQVVFLIELESEDRFFYARALYNFKGLHEGFFTRIPKSSTAIYKREIKN